MRTVVALTAVLITSAPVILSAPALAQRGMSGAAQPPKSVPKENPEETKRKNAEADKAYKAAVDRVPDKRYDPWGGVRK